MKKHRFIFVGGLHRSGTWLLTRCMEAHPQISRLAQFDANGAKGEFTSYEGQYLQTVYPTEIYFGGTGRFGFYTEAHLTEESPLVTEENRAKLSSEWSHHWDTSKPLLLEKTPSNIIRSRFLQAMFPSSQFIFIMRHPVAVALAQQKWSGTSIMSLIEHWLVCYEMLIKDTKYLKDFIFVRYEHFVKQPQEETDRIYSFLGLDSVRHTQTVRSDGNEKYFRTWEQACHVETKTKSLSRRFIDLLIPFATLHGYPITILENEVKMIIQRYESRANAFGYSLEDVRWIGKIEV